MRPTLTRKSEITLWTLQILLALLFLFAGGSKLALPLEKLQGGPVVLPGAFLRFIGVVEVLGALGLVLPGAFRIKTGLTPLAAAGLVIVMLGATSLSAAYLSVPAAIFPFVVGALSLVVALARRPRRLVPAVA